MKNIILTILAGTFLSSSATQGSSPSTALSMLFVAHTIIQQEQQTAHIPTKKEKFVLPKQQRIQKTIFSKKQNPRKQIKQPRK